MAYIMYINVSISWHRCTCMYAYMCMCLYACIYILWHRYPIAFIYVHI